MRTLPLITEPTVLSQPGMEPWGQPVPSVAPGGAAGRTSPMQLRSGLRLPPGPTTPRGAGGGAGRAPKWGPVKAATPVRGPMKRPTWGAGRAPTRGRRGSPRWAVTSSWRWAVTRTVETVWEGAGKVGHGPPAPCERGRRPREAPLVSRTSGAVTAAGFRGGVAGAALPTVSSARGLVSAGRVSQLSPSDPAAVPTAGPLGRAQPQAFLLSDRFVEIVPHLEAFQVHEVTELCSTVTHGRLSLQKETLSHRLPPLTPTSSLWTASVPGGSRRQNHTPSGFCH